MNTLFHYFPRTISGDAENTYLFTSLLSPGWIWNRNDPIARAELYQLSEIPPDASKVSGREQMPRRIKTNLLIFGLYFGAQRRVVRKG